MTDGRLKDSIDKKDFIRRLKTVHYVDDLSEYTDIGFVLLGFVIEKVTGKTLQQNYEQLFEQLQLYHTKILPKGYILKGNGNKEGLPHDFKTRIFGITGAAGVFSNVKDMTTYATKIMNGQIFDEKFLDLIFDYEFLDPKHRKRSLAGLYKYTENYPTYVAKEYSNQSLANQGFTGGVMCFDFKNHFINVIFFDAIKERALTKQDNFQEGFKKLYAKMVDITVDKKVK